MDPTQRVSLDQILAIIPSQSLSMLDQKVNDAHLAEIAKELANWESVCTYLEIREAEEEAIREENDKTEARRLAVLRRWRSKHGLAATYRNLAKCFYSAGRLEIVEVVCQALGSPYVIKGAVPPSPLTSPSGVLFSPGGSSTASVSPKENLSKAAVFVSENRQAIKSKFADFQTKVCEKFEQIGVDIRKFRQYVAIQFSPGDCIPSSPTSLMEIFEAITHHELWDYFHYSPLVKIIQKFGASDPEMKAWIKEYRKDLRSYKLVTTVADCIESECDPSAAHSSPEKAKDDSRYFTPVEWKTDHEFVKYSLQYLTDVWEMFSSHYLLPDSPPTALLDRVRKGCVSITWLVPSKLVSQLVKMAKIDTHFFQKHRILKVTVGGQCVYEEEESISAIGMDPQERRKRKLEDDLETDQPAPKRCITTSKNGPSKPRSHQAEHQSNSKTNQHTFDPPHKKVLSNKQTGYACEFIDPPPAVLETKCPICHDVLRKPNQTSCGHIFCETCIKPVQAQTNSCPLCNCQNFSIFPDNKLQRDLGGLQVHCMYQKRGCTWTGELGKLDTHLNCDDLSSACEYADIHCKFSYVGCTALMPRKDMMAHMEEEQPHHIELLAEKVEEQEREIEKLKSKEEETACIIQQMQEEFTLQLQSKNEEITEKIKEISALQQSKQHSKHLNNFCFTMDSFNHHKENNTEWYSEPFYTHPQGYKMCVRIDANGFNDSNFVSLFTCIMKGEYDDELSWPFHGKITVELLNQKADNHHYAYTISYDETIGQGYYRYADRVIDGEKNPGWGSSDFISHHKISQKPGSTVQYLKDDCLKFRIHVVQLYS